MEENTEKTVVRFVTEDQQKALRRALFVGAREQTRTATACGHHPLKMACLPISPRGQSRNQRMPWLVAPVNPHFLGGVVGVAGAGIEGAEMGAEVNPLSSTERFDFTIATSMTREVAMKIAASQ